MMISISGKYFTLILPALFIASTLAGQISGEFDTWWEKSGYLETPKYDETNAYCRKLSDASPMIDFQVFGISPQGRALPLLIFDRNGFTTPAEVNQHGKIKVLIQACIHAGESEGKDAGLALFRDIAIANKDLNLDSITILFIPIFNVDGHEKFTAFSRINQNGPKEAGWRTTPVNLNLNRDYLKSDSPEMEAWLKLFNDWDPDFFIDCHTTDGADYQYPVTLDFHGFNNKLLSDWLSGSYMPRLTELMEKVEFPVFNYVSFRVWHDPRSGLVEEIPGPRFSTGYVAARNRFSLLIETHMLKTYKTRVLATYHVLENTLRILATEKSNVRSILHDADQFTSSDKFRDSPCLLHCNPSMTDSVMTGFLGFNYTVEKSELTGGNWYKYSKDPQKFNLPLFNRQVPSLQVQLPVAYIIPVEWQDIIHRLDVQGIRYVRLDNPKTIGVTTYRFTEPVWAREPYEGRQLLESFTSDSVTGDRLFPKGSAVVPTSQPLARLIAFMFEPQTDESFLKWGFFNGIFEEKEYVETYVMEKMAREMINRDPGLKVEFERYKLEHSETSTDSYSLLKWFYRKTPFYDPALGLYPVGKIYSKKTMDLLINP
jgi:hypothetical protein